MSDHNKTQPVEQLNDVARALFAVVLRKECNDVIEPSEVDLSKGLLEWTNIELEELLRIVTEAVLEAQATIQTQADYYERTEGRTDYRNGHRKVQKMSTPLGLATDVMKPRLRHQSLALDWLGQRLEDMPLLGQLSRQLFSRGLSVRAIAQASEALFGGELSKSTISRFNEELDKRYQAWLDKPIEADIEYLFLDGINLKVSRGKSRCAETALVAMGIDAKGQRQILGFVWGAQEQKTTWMKLLNQLERKGLEPDNLKLTTVDGDKGLLKALDSKWPEVKLQRCWAHKARNIVGHASREYASEISDDVKQLQEATTRQEAQRLYEAFIDKWDDTAPKSVRCLKGEFEQLFAYLGVPSHHWKLVRTTNHLERAFREFRRKFKNIPMMPNAQSAQRLVWAQCDIWNRRWAGKQVDYWRARY